MCIVRMTELLLFSLVEDLIDAYQSMRSSLDVQEPDEVITLTCC